MSVLIGVSAVTLYVLAGCAFFGYELERGRGQVADVGLWPLGMAILVGRWIAKRTRRETA